MIKDFKTFAPSNGKRPIEFQGDIPIVGQPFVIKGGFPTVNLMCTCSAPEPVLLVGALPGACTSCGRRFGINTFTYNSQSGWLEVNLNVVNPQPAPVMESPA